MSYLDYYIKNFGKGETPEDTEQDKVLHEHNRSMDTSLLNYGKYKNQDVEKIQGTCHTMCPMDESRLRIREHMVHVLEKWGTETKLVKSYSRPAADSNMAKPQQLRPFNILRVTVAYLLFDVTKRTDVATPIVYDFLNDRLRAVRQDMTIQRLSPQQCARLLDPMVRFYIYFGYMLHGLPVKDFDPVLHKMYLLECQKWFLSCTEDLKDYGNEEVTPAELGDLMTSMNIEQGESRLACDQLLMECLYILCNLEDVHPLRRFVNLPVLFKKNVKLKLAVTIAINNRRGNFVQVTRLLKQLCPLSYCALCQYLPDLQRRAIKVLTRAYSNKQLAVPSSVIKQWLAFSSEAETLNFCRHYGLEVVDGTSVRFVKEMLKPDVKMHQSNIRLLKDEKLNLDLLHVLTYTTK